MLKGLMERRLTCLTAVISLLPCEDSVLLLLVLLVAHSVKAELSSLSERLLTSVDPADEGLGLCVNKHMLLKVLFQREALATELAAELLHAEVSRVVSSEGELGAILFLAVRMFTDKSSRLHLNITKS